MLCAYVSPAMDDWDRCLAPANFACANAKSALTGYSPFLPELRHPRVPAAVMQRGSTHTSVPSAENFVERMDALLVDDLSHAAQQRQKFYADHGRVEADLKLADAYFFVPSGSRILERAYSSPNTWVHSLSWTGLARLLISWICRQTCRARIRFPTLASWTLESYGSVPAATLEVYGARYILRGSSTPHFP